jgi:dethiobiotin synthetase
VTGLHGLFITGTDTGVGKTYIGAAVIPQMTARGVRVVARKPVESGCELAGGKLVPADAIKLHTAASRLGDLGEVCPYRLRHALSPERAAQLEGLHLTIADLQEACVNNIDGDAFLWVEGAGGFYSPLASDGLNADLAARLGLPVLLVAADRLGCINHVLLTVEAIRARGLDLLAVALNKTTPDIAPMMDNAADLSERLECPLFSIGHFESDKSVRSQIARLSQLLKWRAAR